MWVGSGSFGGRRGAGGGGSLNMGRQYPTNRTQPNRGAVAGNFTRQGNFVNDRHISGIVSEVVKQLRGQWSNQPGNGGVGGRHGED